MADKVAGFGKPSAVFLGGKDFSTDADTINSGFEQVSPRDGGAPFGESGPSVSTGLPMDLMGPHGFLLSGSAAQNIVTDVNGAGLKDSGSLSFDAFDERRVGGNFTPDNPTSHDGLGVAGSEKPDL